MPRPRGYVVAVTLLALAAVGTLVYWIDFFTAGTVHVSADRCYLEFERAFPLADGWMAGSALVACVGLVRRASWGVLWGLLAASGLVYLGCMDVLYNLNEGTYGVPGTAKAVESLINAFCLLGGAWLIRYLWRNRSVLS